MSWLVIIEERMMAPAGLLAFWYDRAKHRCNGAAHQLGIRTVVILTGTKQGATEGLSRRLGVDDVPPKSYRTTGRPS